MDKIRAFLNNPKIAPLVQFVKFGIVGVSNTAISYGIEMLCYYVLFKNTGFSAIVGLFSAIGITVRTKTVKIVITTIIAFIVSVTNSYYWNNRYVFNSGTKSVSSHLKSYLKTFLCYGITGLVMSPVLKVVLSNLGIPYFIASFASLIITIPLNFVMNKFWAFRPQSEKKDVNE